LEIAHADSVADGGFHRDSVVLLAGGLKGLKLPEDYADQMARFLGPVNRFQLYSMSELSSPSLMCAAGVYHVPPWMMPIVVDESGEHLLPPDDAGKVRGRMAFYDPIWDSRWGGIVSGDHVTADFSPRCECGRAGPTIEDSVVRYSELSAGGDDKLTCGGTIEAYIRGVVEES
jgi:hypothetical protein